MFEYVNTGSIVLGSIVCVMLLLGAMLASGKALHENRKTKAPYFFLSVASIVVTLIFWEGIDTKEKIDENLALFKNGKEIKCSTLTTNYLVSKQTGWKLHKQDFIKDSILLNAQYCREY